MNISFVGLGKLGLCSAACFAANGHHVIGVDNNSSIITALNNGECPINENGLRALIEKAKNNICYTENLSYAVANSDITMIIVPTPSQKDGQFSNKYIETAIRQLAPSLKEKSTFHIVDIVSTVMPGSCDNEFIPLLEQLTEKTCGKDFGVVYNPEFIALGSVIHDFLNPDLVLIGASDELSGKTVQDVYSSIVATTPKYAIMSLINAEITKLSLNCFVTMKISFINELCALCEKIPGANVDYISDAIGADSRVGSKYLKGGLGFGGPCFPRDNIAFQAVGRSVNFELRLAPQVASINKDIPKRIFSYIHANTQPGATVALFGVSYKRGTHITEESQSLILARHLLDAGYSVRLYDLCSLDEAKQEFGSTVTYCDSPYDAAKDANCIVLLAAAPEFAEYNWEQLGQEVVSGALLLDAWRILANKCKTNFTYLPLGTCSR